MDLLGAVMVILNDKDEVLLLKRSPTANWQPNNWGFPGGKIEPGEAPLDAAVRETKEETGLDVSDTKEIKVKLDKPLAAYYTRDYSGVVKIDFEHSDWAWVSQDDFRNYPLVPQALEMYEWVLKNG